MVEAREQSEQVIRSYVLDKQHEHGLNERRAKALSNLIQHGKITIQNLEAFCPTANLRSLRRDLKGMLDKNLVSAQGATKWTN